MINTAPENLDREKKASDALEGAKKEYVPYNPKNSQEKKDADIDIEAAYDEANIETPIKDTGDKKETESTTPETNIEQWLAQQLQTFAKNNPDKINRIPAAENIPNDINDPKEKNNIFGKISKRILWPKNT